RLLARAHAAGETAETNLGGIRLGHEDVGLDVIDPDGPVGARRIPVELVVVVEEEHSAIDRVPNAVLVNARDRPVGIADADAGVAARARRLDRQRLVVAVGHTADAEPDVVVGRSGTVVHDRNFAVDAVFLLALEVPADALLDVKVAVGVDVQVYVEVE